MQFFRPEPEHFDQAGFIQHGVRVRRADQAGHAPGHGCRQFAFQHAFVLMPRLTQANLQVDQPGGNNASCGIDDFVGREVIGNAVQSDNSARSNGHIADHVQAGSRIHHPAVFDQ